MYTNGRVSFHVMLFMIRETKQDTQLQLQWLIPIFAQACIRLRLHTPQRAPNEIINYTLPTRCIKLLLASLTGSSVLVGAKCGVLKAI